jgi:hypothetical protein
MIEYKYFIEVLSESKYFVAETSRGRDPSSVHRKVTFCFLCCLTRKSSK